MDTSLFDSLAGTGMPLISSPVTPQVTFENPSTLQLAIIGIATLAAYWAVRRLLFLDKKPSTAARTAYEESRDPQTREAA